MADDLLMEQVYNTLDRLYQEQYNHPIQTRPRPKPGVTGEEPGDIHVADMKDEGGNTSYSAKRVNRARNREFDPEDNDEDSYKDEECDSCETSKGKEEEPKKIEAKDNKKFQDEDEEEGDEEDKVVTIDN